MTPGAVITLAAASPHHQIVRAVYLLPPWMTDSLDGATIAATLAIFLFVLQYTLTSPWWRDQVGTTIVVKDLALLAILVPSCAVLIWHSLLTVRQSAWISLIVLSLMTLVMLWRCVVWYRVSKPRFLQGRAGRAASRKKSLLPRLRGRDRDLPGDQR